MRAVRRSLGLLLAALLWAADLLPAQELARPSIDSGKPAADPAVLPRITKAFNVPGLPPSTPVGDKPLPINLATALRLANVRSLDIAIAARQVQAAAARLQGAQVLWLPTLYSGAVYQRHEGLLQNTDGTGSVISRGYMYLGTAPFAVFALTEAIFQPLVTRQVVRQREAELQATTNDTVTAVARVYFDALQARAELAAAQEVYHQAGELVRKARSLSPGIVPEVEVYRTEAQLQMNAEAIERALQRWRVASAEVVRVTRLEGGTLIEPVESPQMKVDLIDPSWSFPDLVTIAWSERPELAAHQAAVQAAVQRLRQEKWRPFLPMLLIRGSGTQTPYPMMFGAFATGTGGSLSNFGARGDFDLQALWELRNLGLGNRALIRETQALSDQAELRVERLKDYIVREVTEASAVLQSATARIAQAEIALQKAEATARYSLKGVGETKRAAGNIMVLVIRPQEAVAALQVLLTAYQDYFGAVADYNRAQFALYRALGSPAQLLDEIRAGQPEDCRPLRPASTQPGGERGADNPGTASR